MVIDLDIYKAVSYTHLDVYKRQLVQRALRNSGYKSEEEFAKLPEACQRAVGTAANLKEWALMDSDQVATIEQRCV